MIEAMVTLVLVAITGLGMVYITGRSAVAQKDMNVLGLAIGQMRNQIMSGQCNSTSNTNVTLSFGDANSVSAHCRSVNTSLQITSDNPGFTASTVTVAVPRISTNEAEGHHDSQDLLGGQVLIQP